jgi:hypothetical protein
MPEGKTLVVLGLVFGGLGVLLNLAGLALSVPRFLLVLTGAVADGEVVEIKTGSKNSKRPIVEFKPKGKPRARVTATVGNSSSDYAIGQRVNVYYDSSDPSDALIDSFTEIWFFPIMFNGMGFMWLAGGLPCLLVGRSRQRARDRVRRDGLHSPGTVVDVTKRVYKNTAHYTAIVQALDPATGAMERFESDSGSNPNLLGRPATVHLEAQPPHRYFVDVAVVTALEKD